MVGKYTAQGIPVPSRVMSQAELFWALELTRKVVSFGPVKVGLKETSRTQLPSKGSVGVKLEQVPWATPNMTASPPRYGADYETSAARIGNR